MRIAILITLVVLFHVTTTVAQPAHATIDSLKTILAGKGHDSLKVMALFAWDDLIYNDDPELDQELNIRIKVLCERNNKKKCTTREHIFYKSKLASAYNNLGLISSDHGNFLVALDYYHKSLLLREELNDKKGAAMALGNLGNIYYEQKELDKAMDYYEKSLKLSDELKDKVRSATSINNIANIYADKKDQTKAIEYYMKSLVIGQEIDDQKIMSFSLNNIGNLYKDQKDYKNAIYYYQRSLNMREFANDQKGIASSLNSMGLAYIGLNNFDLASRQFNRAMNLANACGSVIEMREAAKGLYHCYRHDGNYKRSLEMHELYLRMRDSLENEENITATIQQEYRYKYAKKSASDSIQRSVEKKLSDAKLSESKAMLKQEQTQRYALYGGLAIVLLFSGFLFNRFRVIRKQKRIIELKELETQQQKSMLEEKQKEIIDSIHYAKRIQESLLPSTKSIERTIKRLKK